MRMDGQEESSNVEDVRGMGGGGGGFGFGGRGLSIGGIVIAVIVGWIFGINPLQLLGMMDGSDGGTTVQQQGPAPAPPKEDAGARFVSQVLRSTEQVWTDVFRESGRTYQAPKLVLFSGSWPTACGQGQAAMGPFYCPEDRKVYIDLSFYRLLEQKLGAPGQFAQAYVVAHEVGHHVQNQLGIMDKVDKLRGRGSEAQANALSVRVELQADCFAGVWAFHANRSSPLIEPGDAEEGMRAASAIGDDRLQREGRGRVVPESFTHGSSDQRVRWFKTGMASGRMADCDTFSGLGDGVGL
jgi:predicted metalloprotease